MAKVFYISGLNAFRWTLETFTPDPNINGLPLDYDIDPQSYAIPIQKTDTEFPALVCLSDYPDMVLEFRKCTGELITTPTLGATESSIIDQTFLQYLAIVDFSSFPSGRCYGRVSYIDENSNPVSWISCPIDVQDNHPDTQLIQYQNSVNSESVLFHPSNLILQTRIAANFVGGYQPKANRETFEDQPYNPVLLNGFNYDIYTQYLTGDEVQLPDWRIKQLNLIWAKCDQVKIDYDFFVAVGDFKGERPTYTSNRNGYNYEIDLQIVKGFEFGQLTAGTTPTGDLIVVRKTWPAVPPFPTYASSFAINGVFTQYSTIDYFETINPGLATFNLKIGTTLGGGELYDGEIGTPNADDSIELVECHRPLTGFNSATTLYVTIPDGVSLKFIVVYDQLDSPAVNPSPSVGAGLPQGTIAFYKELVAGYFIRDWDIATGLGQVGSLYEGCQILDEAAGKVLVAWDRSTIDPAKGRGTPGITGALQTGNLNNIIDSTTLGQSLPNKGIEMFVDQANNTNGDKPGANDPVAITSNNGGLGYEMHKAIGTPTRGLTAPLGAGLNLNVANDGLIMLAYIKL